jgi:DNA invertase Pin-like site-specific DNA recombinase
MRVALYLRVSTAEQTVENQEAALRAVATARGWQVVEVYRDEAISGAKGRDKRPGFDKLWKNAARRKFDLVAAWSVDRLGRSLADVAAFMVDMRAYGVDLYLDKQAVDTTTPSGRALLQMAGVFAEFEREMIRERTLAGQARARANGVRFGRPTIPSDKAEAIVADLKAGVGIVKLAVRHGVGVSVVQRLKRLRAA